MLVTGVVETGAAVVDEDETRLVVLTTALVGVLLLLLLEDLMEVVEVDEDGTGVVVAALPGRH